MIRTPEQEPFKGNPATWDTTPYDPDNPYRTNRQRIITKGLDPDEYEAEIGERDKGVFIGFLYAAALVTIILLAAR